MSDRWKPTATAITILVVACLFVAPIAPVVAVSGVDNADSDSGVGGSAVVDSVGDDVTMAGAAADFHDKSHDSDAIGPGLHSANGSVQLVVRFEGDTQLNTDNTGTSDTETDDSDVSTDGLKLNSENAQTGFEEFAGSNPAVTVDRSFWLANAMLVTVDTDRVPIDRLLDVRGVERVHKNFEVELGSAAAGGGDAGSPGSIGSPSAGTVEPTAVAHTVSTTTTTDATYGVEMVRAPEVWETFDTRGEGATVAVLDTGIDPDHPDLTVSGWAEYDKHGNLVSDNQNDAGDGNGHGTHVAGTVAGGNASGIAIGVAPDANLHGIKVFDDDGGNATFARLIAGMEHAANDSDVDILQMSLGAAGYRSELIDPVQNARDMGKLVVAASGNGGQGSSSSPANVYDSLAVGAVNDTRGVADFSSGEKINTSEAWGNDAPKNWSEEYIVPDVSAPGVNINSSVPGGGYDDTFSGTSMAAPHVSGVAALVLSASTRDLSDQELYDTIRDTANHPENETKADTEYGTGIADGFAAVKSVSPFYKVSDVTSPAAVERNDPLNVTANVTNTGGVIGENRTVELRLTDPGNESNVSVLAATNVTLDTGNSTTVSLKGTVPGEFETGKTTVAIASPEDSDAAPIRIADAVGTINGTVTDAETNATLPDIGVTVENGTEVVGETTTADDGTYAIDVPATDLTVTVSNATYAPASERVTLSHSGDTATANFSLALRNGTLAGVVRADDGLDLPANATVTVTNETGGEVAADDAAEDGTYAVELRPDTYNITADALDFESQTVTGVSIEANATTDGDFELASLPATLFGTVTNESDDAPIEGATVAVGSGEVTTGADGNYSMSGIARGERTATASADGYADTSQTVDLVANQTRAVSLSLDPRPVFEIPSLSGPSEIEQGESGSFTVDVRNDGRAAGDASAVIAVPAGANADPNPVLIMGVSVDERKSGSFSVAVDEGVSTGAYTVTAMTGDDSRTASFEVVSGGDDGGGSTAGGSVGGGGGGGGGATTPPEDNTDDADEEEEADEGEPEADEPADDMGDDQDEAPDDTGDADETDDADGATDDEAEPPEDDTEVSNDDAPGFGVLAAVVSLVTMMLLARRARREGS